MIDMFNANGYSLTKMHMARVNKWFGPSLLCVWEQTDEIKKYKRRHVDVNLQDVQPALRKIVEAALG